MALDTIGNDATKNAEASDDEDEDEDDDDLFTLDSSTDNVDNDEDLDDQELLPEDQKDVIQCDWENKMMLKQRTVYIFRSHERFLQAMVHNKLFPGIVTIDTLESGRKVHQVYSVFRLPGKTFGWSKVTFDDDEVCFINGLTFAPITIGPVKTAHNR